MFKSCLTSYERNKYLEIKILVNIRKYQIGEAVVLEMAIVVKKYAKADIRIYEFTTTHAHFSLLLSFFTQPECKHIFKQGTIALYSQGLHRKFLKKSQEKGLKYVNINVADFSTVIVLNLNFKAY